jgi:beta-galactosidase
LWRPIPAPEEGNGPSALHFGGGNIVFTLKQEENELTGTVEGGDFLGGHEPLSIEEGRVDVNKISFKAANITYSGSLTAGRIELQRTIHFPFRLGSAPELPSGTRPAIGPPPDGTDPSIGSARRRPPAPLVLQRVRS